MFCQLQPGFVFRKTKKLRGSIWFPAEPSVANNPHAQRRAGGKGAAVFAAAAERGVAVELDGDPARQDLDHTLAHHALTRNCLFALDSDAHTTTQLSYADTALAHARLAGVPAHRIVNCWPLERLLAWLADPTYERRQ